MSGSSGMLQKKLLELETELDDVFRRPLDPTASDPRHQMDFNDIKKRFSFLGKLLAAEVDSQPQTSDQLQEIDQKLTQLKAAFRKWNKSRSCIFDNPDNTMSICSDCTQALLYDDDDDVVESSSEAEEDFSGEESLEKSPEKDDRKREERKSSEMGNYCGAFGCGMIVGAVIISIISSSGNVIEDGASLFPPPT